MATMASAECREHASMFHFCVHCLSCIIFVTVLSTVKDIMSVVDEWVDEGMNEWMNVDHWWNNTDRGKLKLLEKTLF